MQQLKIQLIFMMYNSFKMELQTNTVYDQYVMVKGFIGLIFELSQIFATIYDTNIQPFTYTRQTILTLQITKYH